MFKVGNGKVDKRGSIVIPAQMRRQYGLEEGSPVIAEPRKNGILIRAAKSPVEIYTAERKAEFLLNNAVDAEDYTQALKEVRKLGLNPASIPHRKPRGA